MASPFVAGELVVDRSFDVFDSDLDDELDDSARFEPLDAPFFVEAVLAELLFGALLLVALLVDCLPVDALLADEPLFEEEDSFEAFADFCDEVFASASDVEAASADALALSVLSLFALSSLADARSDFFDVEDMGSH